MYTTKCNATYSLYFLDNYLKHGWEGAVSDCGNGEEAGDWV